LLRPLLLCCKPFLFLPLSLGFCLRRILLLVVQHLLCSGFGCALHLRLAALALSFDQLFGSLLLLLLLGSL